jgi:hypothetical protein
MWMHLRVANIDSRRVIANLEERFAPTDLMELAKALAERFEDSEFVKIWHFSKVYQALL